MNSIRAIVVFLDANALGLANLIKLLVLLWTELRHVLIPLVQVRRFSSLEPGAVED